VAAALLVDETIDGARVASLVDDAFGGPVHQSGPKAAVPSLNGKSHPEVEAPLDEAPVTERWAPPAWPGELGS